MMALTSSKQCIHFLRSDLCPPTSTSLNVHGGSSNSVTTMPVVRTRVMIMSSSVGTKSSSPSLTTLLK